MTAPKVTQLARAGLACEPGYSSQLMDFPPHGLPSGSGLLPLVGSLVTQGLLISRQTHTHRSHPQLCGGP